MRIEENDNSTESSKENSLVKSLREVGIDIPAEQRERISEKIKEIKNYVPKVGVLGKTGAGKSSLCNALFGKKVAEISDIAACTREPQRILLSLSEERGSGLILVDVPGVGESRERDREYTELYKQLLPELDLALWVIKADDRAMSVDEAFYKTCVEPAKESCPVVFVLNQVDKVEPYREWDEKKCQPGPKQLENIRKKAEIIAGTFGIEVDTVCAVSANENFGLVGLVEHVVSILPNEKKFAFVREAKEETVSEESAKKAEKGVWDTIMEFTEKAMEFYAKNKEAIHYAISTVMSWWGKKKA